MRIGAAIDARTQLFAVLGWPVAHSLSPVLHNAAFAAVGRNAVYVACAVPPGAIASAMAGLRALGIGGVNVTVPHKQAVMEFLDWVDPLAREAGAVNTVANRDGRLLGYNTDCAGFLAALADAGFAPSGRSALIFGAGGAGRGVALALARAGARRLWVANRTLERAEALAAAIAGLTGVATAVKPIPLDPAAVRAAALEADLVVNCTSVGLGHGGGGDSPWDDFSVFPPGTLVMDLIYNPERTAFLARAEAAGLRIQNGLGMLVHQAALAWEKWFGETGPVDVMYRAARAALAAGH